jgi:periplasmic divalent cation tolerance protein
MTTPRVWTVTSTTPTEQDARTIATTTVAERLAAGAEITGPALSIFWHLGTLGEGTEWRVSLRTSPAARDRLAARIAELHPWDSPEITATSIEWCSDTYADWVERTTSERA